jgi:hypothetical protein
LVIAGGNDDHLWGTAVISPALSRKRNNTLIVRREDAENPRGRPRSRRGRRRLGIGWPTRTGAIAIGVLLLATVAWLLVFAYLLSLVH